MKYHYQEGIIIPFAQKYYRQLILAVAAIFMASFAMMSLHANAADTTEVVTSDDMATSIADVVAEPESWFFYNDETDTIDNSLGSFVAGPETAPEGSSSVQINVSGTQRRNLATYQFSGTPLADITELKFSTYNPSAGNGGSVNRSGYLNFNVDFDGSDTWQSRLVYVPSANGTVQQDTWQEWDTIDGGNALWTYSGATWPVTGEPGTTAKTWSQILTDYSGVRVRVTDSWLGVRVGEPYANGYTENIDAFKFGVNGDTTVFDFEVSAPDTTAPVVQITEPAAGDVSGVVDVRGSVNDDNPDHYYAVLKDSDGDVVAGPGTVNEDESFTDELLFSFDSTLLEEGETYTIWLAARDAAGNRDDNAGSLDTVMVVIDNQAETKDECKNGGWDTYNGLFKNQGDCVSFVATGGRNQPAGESIAPAAARGRR